MEAGAMGQAVMAGDPLVRDEYIQETGACPYTFTEGPDDFIPVLERLVFDAAYRASEAARTQQYVTDYHDYRAVGRKYWGLIQRVLKERNLAAA